MYSTHWRGSNVVLPPHRKRRVRILMKQSVLLMATLLFGVLTGLGLMVTQTQTSRAQTTPSTKPNILFVLTHDMSVLVLIYKHSGHPR
jgi:hypothetical protein